MKDEIIKYVGKYIKYTSNQTKRESSGPWIGSVWPIRDGSSVVEINGAIHEIDTIEIIEVIDIENVKPSGN